MSGHFNSMQGYLVKTKLPFYHLLIALSLESLLLLSIYLSRDVYYR